MRLDERDIKMKTELNYDNCEKSYHILKFSKFGIFRRYYMADNEDFLFQVPIKKNW